MSRGDTEQLVVELEARIANFERNLKRASASASKEFGAIERRARQAREKVDNSFTGMGAEIARSVNMGALGDLFGGLGDGAIGTAAKFTLVGAALNEVRRVVVDVVASVADIADQADKIGVPVEDFQALGYAARQSGLDVSNITDMLGKLNDGLSEAAAKGGPLADLLAANNIPLRDTNGQLRSAADMLLDIANLVVNAGNEMDATNISTIAFGKSGREVVGFLKQGAPAIRQMTAEARETGAVINEELVRAAAEFDNRWTATWDTWVAKGKASVIEILSELQKLNDWQIGNIDALISASGLRSSMLRGNGAIPGLNELQIADLESMFPSLKDAMDANALMAKRNGLEAQRTAELARQKQLEQERAALIAQDAAPAQIDEWNDRLATVKENLTKIEEQLRAIAAVPAPAILSGGSMGMSFTGTGRLNPTVLPNQNSDSTANSIAGAVKQGLLPLVAAVEAKSYNSSLDDGRYLPGGREQLLTDKTLRQILELQSYMLANPLNLKNSSAMGQYQIVQSTLKGLIEEFSLSLDAKFTPQLQDQLAAALASRRGSDPAALRQEWQGLENVSDADIAEAIANSTGLTNSLAEAKDDAAKATAEWIRAQGLEVASLADQERALSMTRREAAAFLKQKELLREAEARGISVTPEIAAAIKEQAEAFASATVKLEDHRAALQASEQALAANKAMADGLNGAFADSAKGFFTDIARGTDAVEALNNSLTNLADRLLNLALDQVFAGFMLPGTGKMGATGSGKMQAGGKMASGGWVQGEGGPKQDNILTGLSRGEFVVNAASAARHKAILETINAGEQVRTFATGGLVSGPGTGTSDDIPAMLSNGEYVVKASAVRRIGRGALDALNSGQVRLPAFAKGGLVGGGNISTINGAPVDQSINISAPVTVNASGGSPEQNADLAKRVSESVKNEMRALVTSELRQQMRPRGMLNP